MLFHLDQLWSLVLPEWKEGMEHSIRKLAHNQRNPHRKLLSRDIPLIWLVDYRNLCHLAVENPTDHLLWAKQCTWCRPFLNIQEQARNIASTKHLSGLQNKHYCHRTHTTEQRVERHSDWFMNNGLIVMELDWFWSHPRNFLERGSKTMLPKNLTTVKTWKNLCYQRHEVFEKSSFWKTH